MSGIDDFFIGIGDINSSFLPKVVPLTPVIPNLPSPSNPAASSINGLPSSSATSADDQPTGIDSLPTVGATDASKELVDIQTTVMLTQNNAALDAQLEERPLAKKEKELQEHAVEEQKQPEPTASATPSEVSTPAAKEPSPKPEKPHKKALLKNDDYELVRIGKVGHLYYHACCGFS